MLQNLFIYCQKCIYFIHTTLVAYYALHKSGPINSWHWNFKWRIKSLCMRPLEDLGLYGELSENSGWKCHWKGPSKTSFLLEFMLPGLDLFQRQSISYLLITFLCFYSVWSLCLKFSISPKWMQTLKFRLYIFRHNKITAYFNNRRQE